MLELKATKCYWCLCSVCNMRKCPVQRNQNKYSLCYKSCWGKNRVFPRLECDFFEHFLRAKHYKVKRRITQRPTYSSQQVGEMLADILKKMESEKNE